METALLLIALAGAFGSAWLAHRELDPWVKRLGEKGGPPYRRAEWIYAAAVVGSFFGAGIATRSILLWFG
jgi:hypothetical protein